MSQEIHITVPKGAKVVIHEEEAPEVERTLEDRVADLEQQLSGAPEKEVVYVPYPVYQPPALPIYVYPPVIQPTTAPTNPHWNPYKITCGTTIDANTNSKFILTQ